MDFWSRVQEGIERENTSYAYLAQKLGKRESTVSGWHRGEKKIIPAADYAVVIAQTLNTTVEYLVTGAPPLEGIRPAILALAREIARLSPADQDDVMALVRYKLVKYQLKTGDISISPAAECPSLEIRDPEPSTARNRPQTGRQRITSSS